MPIKGQEAAAQETAATKWEKWEKDIQVEEPEGLNVDEAVQVHGRNANTSLFVD